MNKLGGPFTLFIHTYRTIFSVDQTSGVRIIWNYNGESKNTISFSFGKYSVFFFLYLSIIALNVFIFLLFAFIYHVTAFLLLILWPAFFRNSNSQYYITITSSFHLNCVNLPILLSIYCSERAKKKREEDEEKEEQNHTQIDLIKCEWTKKREGEKNMRKARKWGIEDFLHLQCMW